MAFKFVLFVASSVLIYSDVHGQFLGGFGPLPGGGRFQTAGYQLGPVSGSLSQTFDHRGFGKPIVYTGGVDSKYLGGSISAVPGVGGVGNIDGKLNVFETPAHKIDLSASHIRNLDKNLRPVGPETNKLGVSYQNQNNGLAASLSGSQTNGRPAVGTAAVSIPIVNAKDAQVSVGASSDFGHGMKPQNKVEVSASASF